MIRRQLNKCFGIPTVVNWPALMYGILCCAVGFSLYFLGVLLGFIGFLFDCHGQLKWFTEQVLWYSGIPFVAGLIFVFGDLFVLLPKKRTIRGVPWYPPENYRLTVVLTAYNDEKSINLAVNDFLHHPKVQRVLVVDNNSKDSTSEVANRAGATVILEPQQGYGFCVWRALQEASKYTDTELTLLAEGDMTFRSYDIDKFLAYIPHAEIVNGTRIVEQLRASTTQLTTFMYYGNFFVGKLLEAKHVGKGTFTDVGTTYKLCRNSALQRILPLLNPNINLEFNAHFLDMALGAGVGIVECPITFHSRIGESKGGNVNNIRALSVGMRMLKGIVFGWGKQK